MLNCISKYFYQFFASALYKARNLHVQRAFKSITGLLIYLQFQQSKSKSKDVSEKVLSKPPRALHTAVYTSFLTSPQYAENHSTQNAILWLTSFLWSSSPPKTPCHVPTISGISFPPPIQALDRARTASLARLDTTLCVQPRTGTADQTRPLFPKTLPPSPSVSQWPFSLG